MREYDSKNNVSQASQARRNYVNYMRQHSTADQAATSLRGFIPKAGGGIYSYAHGHRAAYQYYRSQGYTKARSFVSGAKGGLRETGRFAAKSAWYWINPYEEGKAEAQKFIERRQEVKEYKQERRKERVQEKEERQRKKPNSHRTEQNQRRKAQKKNATKKNAIDKLKRSKLVQKIKEKSRGGFKKISKTASTAQKAATVAFTAKAVYKRTLGRFSGVSGKLTGGVNKASQNATQDSDIGKAVEGAIVAASVTNDVAKKAIPNTVKTVKDINKIRDIPRKYKKAKATAKKGAKKAKELAKKAREAGRKHAQKIAQRLPKRVAQAARKAAEIAKKLIDAIIKAIKAVLDALKAVLAPILPWIAVIIAVILFFVIIIVLIIMMVLNFEPEPREYCLREAVYLMDQEYHSDVISHINEYFMEEGEEVPNEDINYINSSVSWKEILCYWYVLGCSMDGQTIDGEEFDFQFAGSPSNVADMVTGGDDGHSFTLSEAEYKLLSDSFNELYLILIYPSVDSSAGDVEYYDTVAEVEARCAELDAQGIRYESDGVSFVAILYEDDVYIVDTQHTSIYDIAEKLPEDQKQHILDCMAAVDRDNPNRDLEPTFYDLWFAVRNNTSITVDARDMIVEEAYAMWLMSGAYGNGSATIPQYVRDAYGVETPLEHTIYLESGTGSSNNYVTPFTFIYQNSAGNTENNVVNALPWLDGAVQNGDSVPIFLNMDYFSDASAGDCNMLAAYCDSGVNSLNSSSIDIHSALSMHGGDQTAYTGFYGGNIGSATFRFIPPKCAGYDWNTYTYHTAQPWQYAGQGLDVNAAWCAAFITTLACNGSPYGCFFTSKDFYIDSNHPSWTAYYTSENPAPWQQANEDLIAALSDWGDITDFWDFCEAFANTFYSLRNSWHESQLADTINALQLTAHTDYFRVNLLNTFSDTPAGLFYTVTQDNEKFTPAHANDPNYQPDFDEFDDICGAEPEEYMKFLTMEGVPEGFTAVSGHRQGWYSPLMEYECSLGEYKVNDVEELFTAIAGLGLVNRLGYAEMASDRIGDEIVGALQAVGLVDEDDYGNVIAYELVNFQLDCFCIFGEIREEKQGLFVYDYRDTYCPYIYEYYKSFAGAELYGPADMSMEMYTPSTGDVILYDWLSTAEDGYNRTRNGEADHIGLIVWASPDSDYVAVIEGNKSNHIGMRWVSIYSEDVFAIAHLAYGTGDP